MTKYILHGGNIRESEDQGHEYFEAIVAGLDENPRFLLCFFAQPRELWQQKYDEWVQRISQSLDSQPSFEMATPEDFASQASRADILWIYGGDGERVINTANSIPDFREILSSLKVVTGSSAGAILLVDTSWGCDNREIIQGLNVVPTNTLVHYGSTYGSDTPAGPIDWAQAEDELRAAIGPQAQITRLPEGQFETFVS